MKRLSAFLVLCVISAPMFAAAQVTPDDIIAQIIKDLQAKNPVLPIQIQLPAGVIPPSVPGNVTSSSSPTAPFNPFAVTGTSAGASTPSTPVPPAPSPASTLPANPATTTPVQPAEDIEQLKSLVLLLTAQVRALIARTTLPPSVAPAPVATTSVATSTDDTIEGGDTPFTFTRDLKLGSRGVDVGMVQKILTAKNFFYGDITEYFGSLTRTALRAFQSEYGLPVTGTVGPLTRAALNTIAAQPNFGATIETPELFTANSMSFPVNAATNDPRATSTESIATTTAVTSASSSGPVAVSLSLLPARVAPGGAVSLTWLTQNATTCEGSDGWSGPKPTLGAAKVEPVAFSLNFVLTCSGPLGKASTSAMVIVE